MAYETGDIKLSQELFYYLLEHHELKEKDHPSLYKAYTESDMVQSLAKSQAEYAHSTIERYGDVIYLIPDEDNTFLGYSKAQLKKRLCKSNASDRDYYLAQFAIIVLLLEFYDGQGSSSKMRDYIRLGDLQNSIADNLREGAERYTTEEQQEKGMVFSEMLRSYEALRSDDRMTRQKTTKEGFLFHILRFLQEQGLVEYIEQDEMIQTTRKLDHFMDWNLLNQNHYQRVRAVLGGLRE